MFKNNFSNAIAGGRGKLFEKESQNLKSFHEKNVLRQEGTKVTSFCLPTTCLNCQLASSGFHSDT